MLSSDAIPKDYSKILNLWQTAVAQKKVCSNKCQETKELLIREREISLKINSSEA